jgi:hypothetical protein
LSAVNTCSVEIDAVNLMVVMVGFPRRFSEAWSPSGFLKYS